MTTHHCDSCRRDAEMRAMPASVWWPIMSQLKDKGYASVGIANHDATLCENQPLNAVALRWDGRSGRF